MAWKKKERGAERHVAETEGCSGVKKATGTIRRACVHSPKGFLVHACATQRVECSRKLYPQSRVCACTARSLNIMRGVASLAAPGQKLAPDAVWIVRGWPHCMLQSMKAHAACTKGAAITYRPRASALAAHCWHGSGGRLH